jgi:hypothetical protein
MMKRLCFAQSRTIEKRMMVMMETGRRGHGVRLGARVDAARSESGTKVQRAHGSTVDGKFDIIVSRSMSKRARS